MYVWCFPASPQVEQSVLPNDLSYQQMQGQHEHSPVASKHCLPGARRYLGVGGWEPVCSQESERQTATMPDAGMASAWAGSHKRDLHGGGHPGQLWDQLCPCQPWPPLKDILGVINRAAGEPGPDSGTVGPYSPHSPTCLSNSRPRTSYSVSPDAWHNVGTQNSCWMKD